MALGSRVVFPIACFALAGFSGAAPPTVHVAGSRCDGRTTIACYWRSGVRVDLPGPLGAQASGLALGKDVICVVGTYRLNQVPRACYWVNGARFDARGEGNHPSWGWGIAWVRGQVYVAGSYSDGRTSHACLWIDGHRRELAAPGNADARSIWVEHGRVYVGGCYADETASGVACLWVDGRLRRLPGGVRDGAIVNSVCVAGGRTYAAGSWSNYEWMQACCWLDGRLIALAEARKATAVRVSGGSVYLAGFFGDPAKHWAPSACYWKDDVRIPLPAEYESRANAIAVHGGQAYVAGSCNDGTANVACYWVGTRRIDLPGGNSALGIVVR